MAEILNGTVEGAPSAESADVGTPGEEEDEYTFTRQDYIDY